MRDVVLGFRTMLGIGAFLVGTGVAVMAYMDEFSLWVSITIFAGSCLLAYALYPIGNAYCPNCEGTGEIKAVSYEEGEECSRCEGTGKVSIRGG